MLKIKHLKLAFVYFLLLSSIALPFYSYAERTYSDAPPHQLLAQIEDDGKFVNYSYDGPDPLKSKEFIGAESKILQRNQYTYDDQQRLINMVIDDGSSENINDMQNVTHRRIIDFSYNSADAQVPAYAEEVIYTNQSGLFVETSRFIHNDTQTPSPESQPTPTSDSFWDWASDIFSSIGDTLNNFKEQNSFGNYIKKDQDHHIEQLLGRGYLQFAGYYTDVAETGCTHFGKEIHDKVRVTLINGILNIRSDMDAILKIFSDSHGEVPIHYVFRPTEGWTKDMLASSLSKLGFASHYAELLAGTWRKLIAEMGGVDGGGMIIHYAHSIGATDTYVARNLMTPEELKMIHVSTIGSPTMIPIDSGFASTINYASRRDGVCYLDPVGFTTGYFYGSSKIELIGSSWGIPLIDHTLYTESYGGLITGLGVLFKEMHR